MQSLSGLENSDLSYIAGDELVSFFFRFPTYPKVLGIEVIQIDMRAHTTQQFDREWISGAIEEPLEAMDIKASTKIE